MKYVKCALTEKRREIYGRTKYCSCEKMCIRDRLKLVDGVLSKGTWFHFELIDENGKVVRTAQSIDGIIQFDSLGLDKVGTYRYILREVNEDNEYRIDYDDTEYEVVIEVTQPDITKPDVYKRQDN